MKGSICAVLAATAVAVSCKKQETVNPSLVTSTVEVMLGSPATKAFGNGETLDHEKTLNNVTMFVYKTNGTTDETEKCVLYHRFTDFELKQGKAVFTIDNVEEATSYDFYAVANCTSTNLENKDLKRTQLLAEFEGVDGKGESSYGLLTTYNHQNDDPNTDGFLALLTSAKRSGGFIMSGKATEKTPLKGTNVPTRVKVELRRTVAKVEIKATRTAAFDEKYPKQSTFKITKAELKHLGRSSTLIASDNPTVTERASVLWQNTHEEPAQPYSEFQNLFYIYENGVAGGTTAVDLKPELVLTAVFDYDGDGKTTNDISNFTYTIKLSGEAGAVTDQTDKDFGRIIRNGSYVIDVKINGLTETEVVAEIKVMDWEGPKFQTVNIGE